jgi:hypothetical protein
MPKVNGEPYDYEYKQHWLGIRTAAKALRRCSARLHKLGPVAHDPFLEMAQRCEAQLPPRPAVDGGTEHDA